MTDLKFDWNNVSIIPAIESDIESRTEITPYYQNNKLPLFVAPMDTVVDKNNYKLFLDQGFEICIPRGESEILNGCFTSVGLDGFIGMLEWESVEIPNKILVDIANGHMSKLIKAAGKFKEKFPEKELMIGNIAHPQTYKIYSELGVDYVRCGIGGGSACTTSANGGVHYPMGSLINECYLESCKLNTPAKIVADGGFRSYSDIIKALALGADYVMLGGILNKCLESCSPSFIYDEKHNLYEKVDEERARQKWDLNKNLYKYYRGMSTKEVQVHWGKEKLTTSEGITKYNKVEYTLSGWTENFIDYLKTNMSYCGKRNLAEYIGQVEYILMTSEAYKRFNK